MATKYELVEGTEPSEADQHEPRTIKRMNDDSSVYMMTEIEDGVFVAWGECSSCRNRVATCKCSNGPVQPGYMQKWRDNRFEMSIRHRKPSQTLKADAPETPVDEVQTDVQESEKITDMKGKPLNLESAIEAVKEAKAQVREDMDDVGF